MADQKPFVITIVGAESSGKTMLAQYLASAFDCEWIPEYAREYLANLGRPYDVEDLYIIAEYELERVNAILRLPKTYTRPPAKYVEAQQPPSAVSSQSSVFSSQSSVVSGQSSVAELIRSKFQVSKSPIIIDGGMLTIRMWARIKYGMEISIVEEAMKNDITDLYVLCRPVREWEEDPLREAPAVVDRAWIYNQYYNELAMGSIETLVIKTDRKL